MNQTFTQGESNLIGNCINRDRKSQKKLYDLYSPKMFAICLRYSKTQMDAEDVLQDAFVKLFNNLQQFRGEGSFEGWVRRIVVNTAIEHIRRKNVGTTQSEGLENTIADIQISALDKLYEDDIIKTSMHLSDGYRTVFLLYAVEGYSHKEIANRLGITESTSKSQFSRAKALLRNFIQNKPVSRSAEITIYRKLPVVTM